MISRREMILSGAAALAVGALNTETSSAQVDAAPPGRPDADYTPVVTPNGVTLPYKLVDGVKVFHLVAEEIEHEFAPGLKAKCWGYNGRTPGPTIEVVDGDRVRIYVTNRLPEPTTIHWHGILLENGMDGVAGLTQPSIQPGETYRYEFTLRQHGTHIYHPHFDEMTQIALGMMGAFIIHPRKYDGEVLRRPDRDFVIMLSEWRIDPGASRPNPLEMTDWNLFTMNSKVFPATAPLVAKQGQYVKVRLLNMSPMDHHPIHLHGYSFPITETDGGMVPLPARTPTNTILVAVAQTRTFEFTADRPGDWALHCHMTHHTMNQMGHNVPNVVGAKLGDLDEKINTLLPQYMTMGERGMGEMMRMAGPKNSIAMLGGKGPFGPIDMGGMFTILKVRKELASHDADPGWYEHPQGTVARPATAEEMRRDGVGG